MKKLNTYLANLAVINIKIHNLHWNVVGSQFVAVHEFLNPNMIRLVKDLMKLQNSSEWLGNFQLLI